VKYLVVFAVLFVALWLFRKRQRAEERQRKAANPPARSAPGQPQEMVRCMHCGIHLPAVDAIGRPGAVYCSSAHQQTADRAR
jgi:uncharacterized protein